MLVLSRAARAGGFGLRRGLLQCHARGLCGFDWSQFGPDDVERDPWLVLGVEPDASKAEVKAAFKSRARACHPDMAPDLDPALGRERFTMVQRAYELLEDPASLRRKTAKSLDDRECPALPLLPLLSPTWCAPGSTPRLN